MNEKVEIAFENDPELSAMAVVFNALRSLDEDAKNRVLEYVENRRGIKIAIYTAAKYDDATKPTLIQHTPTKENSIVSEIPPASTQAEEAQTEDDELEGISPIARKWMIRNGLTTTQLSTLFSLGIDEIDLVAQNVPGKSTRDRLHNVILLQGIASYLNSGVPRAENDKLKESIRHYSADVGGNFSAYMKDWASEFSGSRTTGFMLTTRGLSSAKELIKQITEKQESKGEN